MMFSALRSKAGLHRRNVDLQARVDELNRENERLRKENAYLGIDYGELQRLVGAATPIARGMQVVLCGEPYVVKGIGDDEVHLRHTRAGAPPEAIAEVEFEVDSIVEFEAEELDLWSADRVQ